MKMMDLAPPIPKNYLVIVLKIWVNSCNIYHFCISFSLNCQLIGVKKDGSVSYFFHRSFKIYNAKNPRHSTVHNDDCEEIFWQKVGKTRRVIVDGSYQGCKKIMVLYTSMKKGKKPEKSNWVMHRYHLGTGNGEKRELVVSKIFYENAQELSLETVKAIVAEAEPQIVSNLVGPQERINI